MQRHDDVVRAAGLEPARPLRPRDFKSLAFTNFATPAWGRAYSRAAFGARPGGQPPLPPLLLPLAAAGIGARASHRLGSARPAGYSRAMTEPAQKTENPAPFFDADFLNRLEDLIRWRRDVRRFRPNPVDDALVTRLIGLAALAPSVSNSQP